MSSGESILVVAGEVSGDLHTAPVVAEIKQLAPGLHYFGSGGDLMADEGVELFAHTRNLAVMGFSGIPKILPRLARLKRQILQRVEQDKVRLAILTDYPGFNLHLVRALKSLPHPPQVLYYIAPQLWAWRPGRSKIIRLYVDRLAVVFPFEVEFFRNRGVKSEFVGHPLLDELHSFSNQPRPIPEHPLLALLPGSRPSVAKRHIEPMLGAARLLRTRVPGLRVVVGLSPAMKEFWEASGIGDGTETTSDSRKLLSQATTAAVCSGTATLEAALLGAPQVVIYKTSPVNYILARRFVSIPHISLVNVTAGRQIVPELIQADCTSERLAGELFGLLTQSKQREEMEQGYVRVRQSLGEPGAASRVARMAVEMLEGSVFR